MPGRSKYDRPNTSPVGATFIATPGMGGSVAVNPLPPRAAPTAEPMRSPERDRATVAVAEMSAVLAKAAQIGADIARAEDALRRAREALARDAPSMTFEFIADAERLARDAVDARVREIEDALRATDALVAEARHVGADVAEAERLSAQAREAFREKQVALAGELVRRSERSAMRSQQSHLERAIDLGRRQIDRAMAVLRRIDPILVEADALGIDTTELRVLVAQARDVLAKGDTVSGTLFARNAAAAARALQPRIAAERLRGGWRASLRVRRRLRRVLRA